MSISSLLTGWSLPEKKTETKIRKYSTTGDILSYKRCPRQYGFFSVRGFSSATATQRYFGTLVHDVLDRINRNYKIGVPLPSEDDVNELVSQAHDRLIRSGVRPYNAPQQQKHAATLIYRFVKWAGPHFFPNVKETEYRLERVLKTHTNRDYILDGVVDVLSGAVSHSLGLPLKTSAQDIEIWDYKSGDRPDQNSPEMQAYIYQMRVYAELFRQQTGKYPARCSLVFIGELDNKNWNDENKAPKDLSKVFNFVEPVAKEVETALKDFSETVELIEKERSKRYSEQWKAPDAKKTDRKTCEACELRFNCNGFPEGNKLRAEAL